MCLSEVYRGKKKKDFLAALPDEITVWKVVRKGVHGYFPVFYCSRGYFQPKKSAYHSGLNKFNQRGIRCWGGRYRTYRGGCHLWRTKSGADNWRKRSYGSRNVIIRCKIKKEDITSVGKQSTMPEVCIVARKATFPKYCGEKK